VLRVAARPLVPAERRHGSTLLRCFGLDLGDRGLPVGVPVAEEVAVGLGSVATRGLHRESERPFLVDAATLAA
jgi:hypothetical protein